MIKDFLMKQIEDKKNITKREKNEENTQVKLSSNENEEFFKKEIQTNERVIYFLKI